MPVNRGLFVRNNGAVGTTPIEARLVQASFFAENSPGVPRQGLLGFAYTDAVKATANMSYDLSPMTIVTNRASGEGVYVFTISGGTLNQVTTAAPGTGSRFDLIYVKQNDVDKGDAGNTAVVGVVQGTSSTGTPTKPYANVPAGAYVLAEARIYSGTTATNGGSNTITQVWRHTALRGNPIPVRNTTERAEITPSAFEIGIMVRRLDVVMGNMDAIERWDGDSWNLPFAYAEYNSNGFAVAGGLVNWDVGPFTNDGSKTWNNTFSNTSGALSGAINITETGLYTVTMMTLPGGTPGRAGLILKNGASQSYASSFTDGAVWEMTSTFTRHLPAGSYVRGVLIQNNSTTNNTTCAILKHSSVW